VGSAVIANELGDDPAALWARERLEPLLDRIGDPYLRAVSQLAMAWTHRSSETSTVLCERRPRAWRSSAAWTSRTGW
jgi:hypothetical protein